MLAILGLAALTFGSSFAGETVEAYYVRAVSDLEPDHAARMSVAMWAIGIVGWLIVVKVSVWYLIPEVAGLYTGARFAVRRQLLASGSGT